MRNKGLQNIEVMLAHRTQISPRIGPASYLQPSPFPVYLLRHPDKERIFMAAANTLKDKNLSVMCGYLSPKLEAVKFYRNLSKLLRLETMTLARRKSVVVSDFDCPLDITLDKKGGLLQSAIVFGKSGFQREIGFWSLVYGQFSKFTLNVSQN